MDELMDLTSFLKDLLGSKVSKVEISMRLVSSPIVVATTKYGHSANMERITRGQAFGRTSGKASKVVEINPLHPLIKSLLEKVKEDKDSQVLKDYVNTLYDMS